MSISMLMYFVFHPFLVATKLGPGTNAPPRPHSTTILRYGEPRAPEMLAALREKNEQDVEAKRQEEMRKKEEEEKKEEEKEKR